ncbi:MAG: hypothetical protein SV186_06815 [Candidatus Nanohaloarchaea archaeon]|nr:hypothetical protein [Candidatus Nanohaloarchaea archaeon]
MPQLEASPAPVERQETYELEAEVSEVVDYLEQDIGGLEQEGFPMETERGPVFHMQYDEVRASLLDDKYTGQNDVTTLRIRLRADEDYIEQIDEAYDAITSSLDRFDL